MVGSFLVCGECHLIAGSSPGSFIATPSHIPLLVLHICIQGRASACRNGTGTADADCRGIGLDGNCNLCGGEGSINFNTRFHDIASRFAGGKGKGSSVHFHLVVDGPLNVAVIVALSAQFYRCRNGYRLAFFNGCITAIQRKLHTSIVEHCRNRNVFHNHVIARRICNAVTPLIEGIPFCRNCCDADLRPGCGLNIQAGYPGLSVAGQGSLAGIFHRVTGGQFGWCCRRRRRSLFCVTGSLRSTFGDIVCIRAGIIRIVSVRLHVLQKSTGARSVPCTGRFVQITAFCIAFAVLQYFGSIEVLVPHIIAGNGNCLIELVNNGLLFSGIFTFLRNRRNGTRNNITIRIRIFDILQSLFIIAGKLIYRNTTVHIVASDHNINTARFHFGNCLRNGIRIGVILERHTAFLQEVRNFQILFACVLVQRDASVFL